MLLELREWKVEEWITKRKVWKTGDEGIQFFCKFEDDLMRIFGSESMNNILEKLGLKMEKVLTSMD